MTPVCHILNGDALKNQLNGLLADQVLVCREMMMDGPTSGITVSSILNTRREYFMDKLDVPATEYRNKVESEIDKLVGLKEDTKVYLWFEDDLFCQANFWFSVYALTSLNINLVLRYVRPTAPTRYSFGGMNTTALLKASEESILLSSQEISVINNIWQTFQRQDFKKLISLADELTTSLPWVKDAVDAHIARFSEPPSLGAHEQIMQDCIQSSAIKTFPAVFRLFSKKAAIYGFGERQARRIYNKVIKHI